ncbi:hypothetical protein Fmac_020912 [Flemingia macrophylla]|uniref:Nitric oxide synthase-interacting protein zinc-finger domain-containing protein n=1 Tax=Flemingia macrophylla TaxID=520843 RepID=A0ABD1LX32_9FABA
MTSIRRISSSSEALEEQQRPCVLHVRREVSTQQERLNKDFFKPFDACCLCLKSLIDPMSCHKGHLFCKKCILHCLLSQKKDIQRSLYSLQTL